jgi:GT2 family glycosyltransferase
VPVTVVIATRDRRASLLATLERLAALPERPPVVVVDNASSDGTPAAVRAAWPGVRVVALARNAGAAARTAGARLAATPFVAFSDDDSWWAPGALARAADLLDRHPAMGLIAARVLVGPQERLDPTCAAMARSPLAAPAGAPGPAVLGFLACGAVVRRSAFLGCGGFEPRYGTGGEEELLALDLAAAGWRLHYVDEVVAHHHPALGGRDARTRVQVRNALWSCWLRRPAPRAVARSASILAGAGRAGAPGLADALASLRWVARHRRVIPPDVEQALRRLQ